MTLDEAIKHFQQVAEGQAHAAEALRDDFWEDADKCGACSDAHEQLAAWLKELKERRERDLWIPVSDRKPEPHEYVIAAVYGSAMIMQMEGETIADAIERTRKQGYVTMASIDEYGFWNGADGFPMMVAPSYWMPKPALPEAER